MPKNISRDIRITYYEQFYATIISQPDEIDKFHEMHKLLRLTQEELYS